LFYDYFAISVPDKDSIQALAMRLTELGEEHAGVHFATFGWNLPMFHDPDGHEFRFCTNQHHIQTDPENVRIIDDAVKTGKRSAADLGET